MKKLLTIGVTLSIAISVFGQRTIPGTTVVPVTSLTSNAIVEALGGLPLPFDLLNSNNIVDALGFVPLNIATTVSSNDIVTALGFVPISGIISADVVAALGFVPISGITGPDVVAALGYTPLSVVSSNSIVTALGSAPLTYGNLFVEAYTVYIRTNGNDATALIGIKEKPYRTWDAAWIANGATEGILFDLGIGTFNATNEADYTWKHYQNVKGAGMWRTELKWVSTKLANTNYRFFVSGSVINAEFRDFTFNADCATSFGTNTTVRPFDLHGTGNLVENVRIINLKSDGATLGSVETFGVAVNKIRNSRLESFVNGDGGYTAILVRDGGEAIGNTIIMSGATNASGYLNGITPEGDNITIRGNTIVDALSGIFIDTAIADTDNIVENIIVDGNHFPVLGRNGTAIRVTLYNENNDTFRDSKFINNTVELRGTGLGGPGWDDWGMVFIHTNLAGGNRGYISNITLANNMFINSPTAPSTNGFLYARGLTNAWIYNNTWSGPVYTNQTWFDVGLIRSYNNGDPYKDAYYVDTNGVLQIKP